MGLLVLSAYLILVGIEGLFATAIPVWVNALLALIAGILILISHPIVVELRNR